MQKYNITAQIYNDNRSIIVDQKCNSITAINKGASLVTINGIPLLPSITPGQSGESIAIEGNGQEILSGRVDISFSGAGAKYVVIIQKIFVA
jgi:hypothetical protein